MSTLPTRRAGAPAPFHGLGRLRNRLQRLVGEPFALPFLAGEIGWAPAIDVAESDGSLIVTVELPGMKKENVDPRIAGGVLTLKGGKAGGSEREEQETRVVERSHGSFRRSFTLPCAVAETKVAAELEDGVPRVTLPRTGEPNGKKIEIAG